ncbi:MAG: glycosyl hydrolase [bacterium]|nr:MAG: glycosyl hydrolase [bacterium]
MADQPKISILVLNYNGRKHLKECFESLLLSEARDHEILFLDNHSRDNSCEYMKDEFPEIRIVSLDRNYGFAKGNNLGAEKALGEYLVFLNNDTRVEKGWLKALYDVISGGPSIGVVGSKLLFYDDPGKVNSAGGNIVFNGQGYDIGFLSNDIEEYNVQEEKGTVCAASMMVKKQTFIDLGGFDPCYFLYFEDIDLCWRYWLTGYRVIYVPQSVVYHKFGGTSGGNKDNPFRLFYGTRNSVLNVLKNYQLVHVPVPILFNLVYHSLQIVALAFRLKYRSIWSIIKAYGSVIYLLPTIARNRRFIQGKRKVSDKKLFDQKVIVTLREAAGEWIRLYKTRSINNP